MSDRYSLWETVRVPVSAEGLVHGAEPDLYIPDLLNLSADRIASLAVQHVFIDFDGTMAAHGNVPSITETMLGHVRGLATDPRFKTFGIATDSGARYIGRIAASISQDIKLYQPNPTPTGSIMKSHPGFYRRILFDTDIWDTPETAVMIGDSPQFDILAPQRLGMKTILVDRMVKRLVAS